MLLAARSRIEACPAPDDVLEAYQELDVTLIPAGISGDIGRGQIEHRDIDAQQRPEPECTLIGGRDLIVGMCKAGAPLDQETRGRAVVFLTQLATALDMNASALLNAIALLDVLCHRALGSDQVSRLPGACVSICGIIMKANQTIDLPNLDLPTSQQMRSALTFFASELRARHVIAEEVVDEPYNLQEQWVLQKLSWQINVSTVETWFSAFCVRFDSATSGFFNASFVWILNKSVPLTRFVLIYVTTLELQSRRFARGFLCSGLVAAQLVPHRLLYPQAGLTAAEWADIFGCKESSMFRDCSLPVDVDQGMRQVLELVFRAGLAELRQDCLHFMQVMRRAHASVIAT